MKDVLSEIRRISEVMGLINEDTHPTIYSDYTFDELTISNNKGSLVFFSGSKNLNDEVSKYIYCFNDYTCTPKIHITDGETNFEFPQWDEFENDIVKKSVTGDLYMTLKNFKKFYPNYSFDSSNIKLPDVVSTIKKRYNFARNIVKMLKEIYKGEKTAEGKPMYGVGSDENCVTNEGVINYRGVKYGLNNALISNWSILNYFNTNSLVITYLLKLYFTSENKSLKDFNENFNLSEKNFLNWLERNKESLFSPSSSHLDELERLNLTTLKRGISREQDAVKITMKLHGVGEGSITEYCPGSVEDTVNGRDFKVSTGTEYYYYQSKPLTGEIKEENGKYLIYTNSMKPYGNTVNRLIFLNDKGKFYIFDNKDYEVLNRGELVKFSNPPKAKG
jgi:hypothetical protein